MPAFPIPAFVRDGRIDRRWRLTRFFGVSRFTGAQDQAGARSSEFEETPRSRLIGRMALTSPVAPMSMS